MTTTTDVRGAFSLSAASMMKGQRQPSVEGKQIRRRKRRQRKREDMRGESSLKGGK